MKVTSSLLIGLGLLISLAAAAGAILDARQTGSPFDQAGDSGSNTGFVPIIAPQAASVAQSSAPTLPPRPAGLDGEALIVPLTSPVLASQPVTGQAPTQPPPSAAPPLTTQPGTRPAPTANGPLPTATLAPIWIPDRIVIPAIKLDAPAVPSKLEEIEYQGKLYRQWVAPNTFAAGWLTTSASLGLPGNTVLSGHNNAHGEVFGHLLDMRVGDLILVYSGERLFAYVIYLKMILPERFQPLPVRLANAEWILPSRDERLTLVTCWPYESNTHRLVIVATRIGVNGIASYAATPRLTPHPPLSWLIKPSVPATQALLDPSATASPVDSTP